MWLSPVLLQWCSIPVNYVPGPIGWCTHRLLCRLTLRHEQALDLLRASFSHSLPVSTSMDTFPLSLKDQFIASFNPASTSMQWLLAEQMDSRLLCRSVHHNCFSVDLKTSCHQSVASMSGFSYPAMMESVMNSFENGHCTPLMWIWVLHAALCPIDLTSLTTLAALLRLKICQESTKLL
jgi:hypothetical protein